MPSPLASLQRDLFSTYAVTSFPNWENGSEPLVTLAVAPQWMDLHSDGTLSLTTWLRLGWSHPKVQWRPDQHANITSFRVSSDKVWVPDLLLLNKQSLDAGMLAVDPKDGATSKLHIKYDGSIQWVTAVSHKVICEQITYEKWPWGRQTCNLRFGAVADEANSYDINFFGGKNKMNLNQFHKSNQFKILRQRATKKISKQRAQGNRYVSLNYMFSIQRKYKIDPTEGRIDNPSTPQKKYSAMLRKLG